MLSATSLCTMNSARDVGGVVGQVTHDLVAVYCMSRTVANERGEFNLPGVAQDALEIRGVIQPGRQLPAKVRVEFDGNYAA